MISIGTLLLCLRARFLWHKVHGSRDDLASSKEVPVKLEICSGNGDWVAAQAKAEAGRSNWVALELKVRFAAVTGALSRQLCNIVYLYFAALMLCVGMRVVTIYAYVLGIGTGDHKYDDYHP